MSLAAPKKIIWPIEPFFQKKREHKKIADALYQMSQKEACSIVPVYVLSPEGLNWTGSFSTPWFDKYRPLAYKQMEKVLSSFEHLPLAPPVVLKNSSPSLRKDVQVFIRYCKRVKADLVAINTRGQSGISRFLLGSFTETLILNSSFPLFILNSQVKKVNQLKRVLFPTDFSKGTNRSFAKALQYCKRNECELIIYHKIRELVEPVIESGVLIAGGGWTSVHNYSKIDKKAKEKEAKVLVAKAKKQNVSVKSVIEDNPEPIFQGILRTAKEQNVDMILMTSQATTTSAALFGSLSRQIARTANVPLLMTHAT